MKAHYFNQDQADHDDMWLKMAISQGYVPETCLLGGRTVIGLINDQQDPCAGCNCDRLKCKGRD